MTRPRPPRRLPIADRVLGAHPLGAGVLGDRLRSDRRRSGRGRRPWRHSSRWLRAHVGDDGGAASTELVLVMPVLIAFLSLVVVAGRLTDARGDVVSAASDAARAASLQVTPGAAVAEAEAIAAATVAGEGIQCAGGVDVEVDFVPAFERGATVQTTVTCDVQTGDLALLDLPGVVTVTEHAWEPIDAHRSL